MNLKENLILGVKRSRNDLQRKLIYSKYLTFTTSRKQLEIIRILHRTFYFLHKRFRCRIFIDKNSEMYSCTNNRRVSIIILPKAKFQNCDLKLSRSPRDKSKNSEDSNHLFHSRESKDRFKNATFLQIVENGYR